MRRVWRAVASDAAVTLAVYLTSLWLQREAALTRPRSALALASWALWRLRFAHGDDL